MPSNELNASAIFMDDVGVMSDPALRAHEWPRLVAEFFVPVLGGRPEQWSEANPVVFRSLEPTLAIGPGESNYIKCYRARQITWLRGMAAYVGVSAPIDDHACALLARKATDYITQRARTEYQGVKAVGARLIDEKPGLWRQLSGTVGKKGHPTESWPQSPRLNRGKLSVGGRLWIRTTDPSLIRTVL